MKYIFYGSHFCTIVVSFDYENPDLLTFRILESFPSGKIACDCSAVNILI